MFGITISVGRFSLQVRHTWSSLRILLAPSSEYNGPKLAYQLQRTGRKMPLHEASQTVQAVRVHCARGKNRSQASFILVADIDPDLAPIIAIGVGVSPEEGRAERGQYFRHGCRCDRSACPQTAYCHFHALGMISNFASLRRAKGQSHIFSWRMEY